MKENRTYEIIKDNLLINRDMDRFDRIENGVSPGMPDINLCLDGADIWIEAKQVTKPARQSTPLLSGRNHELLLTQRNWMLRQRAAGGQSFLFIFVDEQTLIVMNPAAQFGYEIESINTLPYHAMVANSMVCFQYKIDKERQWKSLRQRLVNESMPSQATTRRR
jgi:hypothetical protein